MGRVQSFEINPLGEFSLAEANAFGFGHRRPEAGARMSLAFAVDGEFTPAGVELEQGADGVVHGRLHGVAPLDAAVRQTSRVLSLDHDGREWESVLDREAPLAELAARVPGMRPVLFHSPYEAAAWSIISARVHGSQAARTRDRLAAQLGRTFTLHGERMHAFPSPERLLEGIGGFDGLTSVKKERLAGVASAALDGGFDVDDLQQIGPTAATERMLGLSGIGPFYAMLIVVRATGFADVLAGEHRARRLALEAYDLPETTGEAEWQELGERWAPFRTWATVLCRVAHARSIAPAPLLAAA